MKENRSNKSYNSRLTRWIDRLLTIQFDIEHLPWAKIGLVDHISRHSNQKAKKISAYDKEFIVAKLKLNYASVNSLSLKPTESAIPLNKLVQARDPAHQITPKFEATNNAIILISTHATRVHKHDSHLSPAPPNQIANTSSTFNNLKYAYLALQLPMSTSLAKRNTTHCKQSCQNWNEMSLATCENQFTKFNFPPIRRNSTNFSKSHNPEKEPELFALNHFGNQLPTSPIKNAFHFKRTLGINYINKNEHNEPSKKRITRFCFTDSSGTANQPSKPPTTSHSANHRSNSPSDTRAASSTRITTSTSQPCHLMSVLP